MRHGAVVLLSLTTATAFSRATNHCSLHVLIPSGYGLGRFAAVAGPSRYPFRLLRCYCVCVPFLRCSASRWDDLRTGRTADLRLLRFGSATKFRILSMSISISDATSCRLHVRVASVVGTATAFRSLCLATWAVYRLTSASRVHIPPLLTRDGRRHFVSSLLGITLRDDARVVRRPLDDLQAFGVSAVDRCDPCRSRFRFPPGASGRTVQVFSFQRDKVRQPVTILRRVLSTSLPNRVSV